MGGHYQAVPSTPWFSSHSLAKFITSMRDDALTLSGKLERAASDKRGLDFKRWVVDHQAVGGRVAYRSSPSP